MAMSSALWDAYREAIYQVDLPDRCLTLQPFTRSAALDRLLTASAQESWTLITAYNPHSIRLPEARNRARQQALESLCRQRGYALRPARGGDRSYDWGWEESCLVLGMTRAESVALARHFGQNAILIGEARAPSRLLDCTHR